MSGPVEQNPGFAAICFGLNRATDERSLALFLQMFCRDRLLETLIPRLQDDEIIELVDRLTALLRAHLNEGEYHELFLDDPDHHH